MNALILPGTLGREVEFFKNDGQMLFISEGRVKSESEMSYTMTEIIDEAIESEPDVLAALMELHPDSKSKRRSEFISCRFSGADFTADLKDGQLQDGEYWPCSKRGNCKYEGTLCKMPIINGERLLPIEAELIRMSTTDKTNEVIAEELNLPLGTFHKFKKKIYEKLAVQTKQELTLIAAQFNLIWH